MSWSRALTTGFAAALLAAAPGCTTPFTKREVVRESEPRRPVTFESPEVEKRFAAAAKLDKAKQVGGTYVGGPLPICTREQYLSENGKFNDAAARCDANQDGVITRAEVEAFEKVVD